MGEDKREGEGEGDTQGTVGWTDGLETKGKGK